MRFKLFLVTCLMGVSIAHANPDFRLQKMERAIETHQRAKPAGWDTLVTTVKALSDDVTRFQYVHALFNQIPYLDGTNGQYMTPLEAVKRGGVVCKDYAMAKYLLLKEAGVNPAKLAIVVHDSIGDSGGAHVVLEMRHNGQTFVSNQWLRKAQAQFQQRIGVTKANLMKAVKSSGLSVLLQNINTAEQIDPILPVNQYPYKNKKTFQKFNEFGNIT